MRAALLSALILAGCSVRELVPDAEPVNGEAGPIADTSAADTSEDQLAPVDVVEPVDAGADAAALDAVELDASAWDAGDVVSVDTKPDASVVDVVDVVDVAQAPDVPSTPCFAPEALCAGTTSCVRIDVDPRHCGRCGNACPAGPNMVSLCVAGVCGSRCATGFTDCDGNPANGCEARLNVSDPNNCGACGGTCPSGMRCAVDRCTNICGATVTYCGGRCVDVATDTRHCGRCGNACPIATSGTVACVGGACVLTCDPAHADCDGNPSNGCETFIGTRANCGGCGIVCAGTLDCANVGTGAAPVLRCGCGNATLTACGTSCVYLPRSHDHCGACGNNCGDHGFCNNAGACLSCGNNPEGIPRVWCGEGRPTCTDLMADELNCGACGTACTGGRFCANGTCQG